MGGDGFPSCKHLFMVAQIVSQLSDGCWGDGWPTRGGSVSQDKICCGWFGLIESVRRPVKWRRRLLASGHFNMKWSADSGR